MTGRLWRELSQFPFGKVKPPSFAVQLAGLSERELQVPIRVWVETSEITKVVRLCGYAKILMTCPWIDFVYLETSGRDLACLAASDLVRSVWNDLETRADGCAVTQADPRAFPLAARAVR